MFSETVDNVMRRAGRPDKLADIVAYVNMTLRECQGLALFWRDLYENTVSVTVGANSSTWTVPNNFRRLRAIKYSLTGYEDVFPPLLRPGKIQREQDIYYYMANNYIVFSGLSNSFSSQTPQVHLAYYTRPIRYRYYTTALRPAVYDQQVDDWDPTKYLPVLTGTAAQQAAQALVQQEQVSNWMLLGYSELIEEGALAKVLKVVGDARAPSSFALYKSVQGTLETLEGNESFDQLRE